MWHIVAKNVTFIYAFDHYLICMYLLPEMRLTFVLRLNVAEKKWKTFFTFVRMFVYLYRNKRALFNCMFADISVFFIALGPFYSCFRAINHDSPSFNSFDRHHVCILFQPKLARA